MTAVTHAFANLINNSLWGVTPYSIPTGAWLALGTPATVPAVGGLGNFTEPAGAWYDRVQLTTAMTAGAASGSITNNAAITFAPVTVANQDVLYLGLFESAVSTQLLMWGTLAQQRTLTVGSQGRFATSQLTFTPTGKGTHYFWGKVLEALWGRTGAWAVPTSYVALGSSATVPQPNGTGFTEVGGETGYVRRILSTSYTGGAAGGVAANLLNAISYPTITSNYPTVAYYALYDALSAGNQLLNSAFDNAATYAAITGQVFTFPISTVSPAFIGLATQIN